LKLELTKLWVLEMDGSKYLRNLEESMPRWLEDVGCHQEGGKPHQVVARGAVYPMETFQG
jgi:hypothetical protein